jgi:hypothetical protein
MSISNYLEDSILEFFLRNDADTFTPAATIYLSLHTADPGETGADECTGGSYARQSIAFGAASSGAVANTGAISFTGMPAATVTHVALWDASSTGNCYWSGALTAPKTVGAGDTVSFAIGEVDVSID